MEPFKNAIAKPAVTTLARALSGASRAFDADAFTKDALRGLSALELKPRVEHVADCIKKHTPDLATLVEAGRRHPDIKGFTAWPLIEAVTRYDDFDAGMEALKRLTSHFTAEFAVRHFIAADHARALPHLKAWARDASEHVRRLASEGTRPRLPWGKRVGWLSSHPKEVAALLEVLKDDSSEYVRRSVANHMNDIAKTDAPAVLRTLTRWTKQATPERQWIVKHASRTLIKQGHDEALALLGFSAQPKINVERFSVSPTRIKEGDRVTLTLALRSREQRPLSLVVDYVVHFMKHSGDLTPKVFKWKNVTLAAKEQVTLTKAHSFRAVTTRKHHAGQHVVSVQVNGKTLAKAELELRLG
jgi:3-methyladenine DNA glycosylase AlkC